MDENVYIYIHVNLTCRGFFFDYLPEKKKHFLIICEMHAKFTPEDVFYVYIYIYVCVCVNSSISDGAK